MIDKKFRLLRKIIPAILFTFVNSKSNAQLPPVLVKKIENKVTVDVLKRYLITPQRIVWKTNDTLVQNAEQLLEKGNGQAYFGNQTLCQLTNNNNITSAIILDFGVEIHGGIQITTSDGNNKTPKVRICFGESVSETFSNTMNLPSKDGATNHHSMRDFDMALPGYGTIEVGSTGFRFVRIELLEPNTSIKIKEIKAVALLRDLPYLGSFRCNDEKLNKIWETAAYTVHLNMQEYLLDGIKRDRMVWAGDLHPEIMTISTVFGYQEIVPKSLDFLKETTPLPKFMNGIPSYSMWWVIMQYDWYQSHGKLDYLKQQEQYLEELLDFLKTYVDDDGKEQLQNVGMRFLDRPSYKDEKAVHAGLQALMVMTFEKGGLLMQVLGNKGKATDFFSIAKKMKKYVPDSNNSKEAASLLSLAGMINPDNAEEIINKNGAENFSAYFGYYMLSAQAKAGAYSDALNNIKSYWGRMLDLGATTFWEEFDIKEAEGAASIDEIVNADKKDYHKNSGDHCYPGLRRSLCHGWSSGPLPWMTENILGVKIIEPGGKKIKIEPHLGDLKWVEGSFPTAYGVIYIKHKVGQNGKIETEVKSPKGVIIVK